MFCKNRRRGREKKIKMCTFSSLKKNYYHFTLKEMKHFLYEILSGSWSSGIQHLIRFL